jgi:solute carrier family 25 2-oxodicarboxylate transporter 21
MDIKHINCVAGALSGLIEVSVSHPFDRMKTKCQESMLQHKSISLKHAFNEMYKEKSFYKGFVPRILGIVPMRLVYWGSLITMNDFTKDTNKLSKYIIPGLVAGSVQTLVDNPIEVMKIKLMTSTNNININDINYKLLYKGFNACLARNILFAIPVGICTRLCIFDNSFLAGATGGIIGSIISHPLDVLKTEMQRHGSKSTSYYTIIKDIRKAYPTNYISKLWAGVSMRAMLGCVNMGIGFLAFDHINKFCIDLL